MKIVQPGFTGNSGLNRNWPQKALKILLRGTDPAQMRGQ